MTKMPPNTPVRATEPDTSPNPMPALDRALILALLQLKESILAERAFERVGLQDPDGPALLRASEDAWDAFHDRFADVLEIEARCEIERAMRRIATWLKAIWSLEQRQEAWALAEVFLGSRTDFAVRGTGKRVWRCNRILEVSCMLIDRMVALPSFADTAPDGTLPASRTGIPRIPGIPGDVVAPLP